MTIFNLDVRKREIILQANGLVDWSGFNDVVLCDYFIKTLLATANAIAADSTEICVGIFNKLV